MFASLIIKKLNCCNNYRKKIEWR